MRAASLSPKTLYELLVQHNVDYFCGVPDSILGPFLLFLEDNAKSQIDVSPNEGTAVGLAIGYHLATSKVPLVYMQNSGLNNALDPVISLVHSSVMNIPMILLIGWRGQPGRKDEPQHIKQGEITTDILSMINIPYTILNTDEAPSQIANAVKKSSESNHPVALLIEDGLFEPYIMSQESTIYQLSREDALKVVIDTLSDSDIVVATNGKISRELFEYRELKKAGHDKDLLLVGGMGHASSIATGIAQQKPQRRVYCLDGDGSVLMHMGALATIGSKRLKNFYHIVINNGSHDSTGGQSTLSFEIDLAGVAKANGYAHTYCVDQQNQLSEVLEKIKELDGPIFVEIRVRKGARPELTRPTISPSDNKDIFMSFLDNPNA